MHKATRIAWAWSIMRPVPGAPTWRVRSIPKVCGGGNGGSGGGNGNGSGKRACQSSVRCGERDEYLLPMYAGAQWQPVSTISGGVPAPQRIARASGHAPFLAEHLAQVAYLPLRLPLCWWPCQSPWLHPVHRSCRCAVGLAQVLEVVVSRHASCQVEVEEAVDPCISVCRLPLSQRWSARRSSWPWCHTSCQVASVHGSGGCAAGWSAGSEPRGRTDLPWLGLREVEPRAGAGGSGVVVAVGAGPSVAGLLERVR